MLNITASAKRHLKTKCIWANKKYVLLDLKPSGCAGFEYTWDYRDTPSDTDILVDNLILVGDQAQAIFVVCPVRNGSEHGGDVERL